MTDGMTWLEPIVPVVSDEIPPFPGELPRLTDTEFDERMTWLRHAAGSELQSPDREVVAVLDDIANAASRCAQYVRTWGHEVSDGEIPWDWFAEEDRK